MNSETNRHEQMDYKLDEYEQEILDYVERGEYKSVPNVEEVIRQAEETARNTLAELNKKTKRINLRLTERDVRLARTRASEEGMPYQTLLASVIHKYLTGKLVERTDLYTGVQQAMRESEEAYKINEEQTQNR